MKGKKYLRLMTKTYFEIEDQLFNHEYGNGIQGTDQFARLKKEMFIERILRNQKVIEQKHFVTKSEFEKGCHMAILNLTEYTYFQAFYEINRLRDYLSHIKNNEQSNSNEIKNLIEKTQKEINDFDLENYLSDLSLLESSLKGKMCHNSAKFIEWIFEDFDFEDNKTKTEPEQNNINRVNQNQSKQSVDKYLGQSSNKKANALFNYLCNNYRRDDNTQIKYINILYYLKNNANKKEYIFELKQKEYKILVEKEQGVTISKFAKSETYLDVQIHILDKLEESFRTEYDTQ